MIIPTRRKPILISHWSPCHERADHQTGRFFTDNRHCTSRIVWLYRREYGMKDLEGLTVRAHQGS